MDQQITALFRKYLSNSATSDEMKELDEWIASNEDFHDWLENQVDDSSAEMDAEKQADILVKIHEKIAVQSKPKFVLPGWMKTVAAVALIVLMAASAAIYFRSNQPNKI